MSNPIIKKNGQPIVAKANVSVVNKDTVTISFPRSALMETNIDEGDAFFTVTNGVVQVSGQIPTSVIPALILEEDAFVPQSE